MTPTRLVTEAALAHEPEPGVFTGRWDCSCGWHIEPADAQDWWRHVFDALPERPALDAALLGQALDNLYERRWGPGPFPGMTTINLEYADAITAEYERLSRERA